MSNNSDIDQLSQQLSKLSVRRSKTITELQSIDKEYLNLKDSFERKEIRERLCPGPKERIRKEILYESEIVLRL